MPRHVYALLASLTLSLPSEALQRPEAYPINAPLRNRGTFHVATGEWSGATPASALGSGAIYNNSAAQFAIVALNEDWTVVDAGRIPSLTSPSSPTSVTGTSPSYEVDRYQIAYCTALAPVGGLSAEVSFRDGYSPCTDISGPSAPPRVASFLLTGLPGAPGGGVACWTVTIDLTGADTFTLGGDADGVYDGDEGIDHFAYEISFPGVTGDPAMNVTGPLLAGNCPGPSGATIPQQGFGTVFGGVPGLTDATGLGTEDRYWVENPNFPSGACFNFGGCGGSGANPYASFYLQLFGSADDPTPIGTAYCSSRVNATGSAALVTAEGTDPNADLTLVSTPVPDTTGQYFYGPMMLAGNTFGDGLLCVGGMTTRILPQISAGMMMQLPNTAALPLNYSAPYASGLVGIQNFQYWFRSGLTTGAGFNTSNAIAITF